MTTSGYRARSTLTSDAGRSRLDLETALGATPSGPVAHPSFFSGFVARPEVVAAALLAVADVAATTYFDLAAVRAASLDPVVTASGDRLRFESFSACNGVHARLDLLADGIDSGTVGFGTTNVDVNPATRTGLAALGRGVLLHLAVGDEGLTLATPDVQHVERPVELPDRWVRGFAGTPALAAGMTPVFDLPGATAAAFLAGLPRGAPGPSLCLGMSPHGLTPTVPGASGSVHLGGSGRLVAVRRVSRFLERMRVFGHPSGMSGWVLDLPGARITLLLTAEPYRGFSGEGSLLEGLAADPGSGISGPSQDARALLDLLAWDPVIDPAWLAEAAGLPAAAVDAALAVLAASGRLGFDLAEQAYFHRDLPLDESRVDQDNPRLVTARQLVSTGSVIRDGESWRAGGHWVRLDPVTCTCRWWSRYGGGRGPCSHVLAVRLSVPGRDVPDP